MLPDLQEVNTVTLLDDRIFYSKVVGVELEPARVLQLRLVMFVFI